MATTKPSIVFAHGLWADGSCYRKLIPTLQAELRGGVGAELPDVDLFNQRVEGTAWRTRPSWYIVAT
jgi:hypothetical protein